jgi:hypothetical protein
VRQAGLAVALAAGLCALASGADAQTRDEPLTGRHRTYESPQHFAVELRFMPYTPDIDSDPALHGNAPYAKTFGSSHVMIGAEFDWQAVRIPHVGTLGPAAAVGYWWKSGNANYTTSHNGTLISGENTELEIIPFYGLAVLRADVIWREFRIPLVPYVKAGLVYALWRASNTLGTSNAQGVTGEGTTWGTQLAAGLSFNLNVLDPYAARNFDEEMGVNGTYFFGEVMRSDLTGLGIQKSPLRVGASTWVLGLAFEF